MSGLGLVLLLLEVDINASIFTSTSLPHVEQNFAPSSILDPHEAQNSYIPPIILLPLPYHMLSHFRYSTKKDPCVRYNSELYLTQGGITRILPNQIGKFRVVDEWIAIALPFLDDIVTVSFDFVYWILFMPFQ